MAGRVGQAYLRGFRDRRLRQSTCGRLSVAWYYRHGPAIAAAARRAFAAYQEMFKWQREKKQTSSNSVVAHELIERVVYRLFRGRSLTFLGTAAA